MSIPPLVCSTPPPPDQCEDDKDPEDFDLQYNLSQEDEEDNYNYGSFSSYNPYQVPRIKTDTNEIKEAAIPHLEEVPNQTESVVNKFGTNANEEKLKHNEDINIEDLDLKLDQEILKADIQSSIDIGHTESNLEVADSTQDVPIVAAGNNLDRPNYFPTNLQANESIQPLRLEQTEETPSYVDEIIAAVDKLQMTPTVQEIPSDFPDFEKENISICEEILPDIEKTEVLVSETVLSKQIDDDFGDFDDFQFATAIEKPVTLDNCDNPWDNSAPTDDDFGDFKANFEEGDSSLFSPADVRIEHSNEKYKAEEIVQQTESVVPSVEPTASEDDDFGDFNDFQTSSESKSDLEQYDDELQKIPILNLDANEEQFLVNVNKIICSVFEDAIEEPVEQFEGKLESVLGETWGYLLAVDDRQPYMVNWNNSLGQKTLLKALCIDSRNILFGPKWNYNMPKYAATLSVAPLQPQKQVASSSSQIESSYQESTSKAAGGWRDPFASEGQESCNPVTVSKNPVIETGPTDRDVFEASSSDKPDKIFSSTIKVQHIRQISLPDTHIFTPTDSETPRSTTIHYDNSPTVLLPQTVIETSPSEPSFKSEPQPTTSQAIDRRGPSSADDDYWEFQNFKGPTSSKTSINTCLAPESVNKSNNSVTYATQVLQPVRVEPIMPTLNWPDPGEVKETFDDFSEFVSCSTSSNQLPSVPLKTKSSTLPDLPEPINISAKPKDTVAVTSDDFDDEFNTFQSALPSTSLSNFTIASQGSGSGLVVSSSKSDTSAQAAPPPIADFDFAFPKSENVKSEPISLESTNKPQHNQSNLFPSKSEFKTMPSQNSKGPISSGLLQPIPAAPLVAQNQQKSGQILQPLSLESFSQINWPNPGIDLQDLSRFNPVETLNSLKSDLSVNTQNKTGSPIHSQKNTASNQVADDDWGEFVSSAPKPQQQHIPKKETTFADDEEWTDFVSSPSVKPQNGLNTISLNVHTNTNLTIQKPIPGKLKKNNQIPLDIPSLNYITPKSSNHKSYNDRNLNL